MAEPGEPAAAAAEAEPHISAAAPALILYHLFEDPTYFDTWGAKGKPFRMVANLIAVVINLLIVVSTVAFCFETMMRYSPDPHRNPTDWETWHTCEMVGKLVRIAELVK